MKTIAVINQKGGVGKTTTTANLGAAIAGYGRNACLIDMDPQAHLTLHLGMDVPDGEPSVYDVLTGDVGFLRSLLAVTPRLCICPATTDLAAAESELAGKDDRNRILAKALGLSEMPLDYLLIDCPPSLGLLTLNALSAADEVIIPLQPHFLAMQGLAKLLETTAMVRQHLNPRLTVSGIVLCMFESVTTLARDVVAEVRDFFESARGTDTPWAGATIFETVIRRNIRLAECPSYGQTVFDYDPRSRGAQDYSALALEFLSRYEPDTHYEPMVPRIEDDRIHGVAPPAFAYPTNRFTPPAATPEVPLPVAEPSSNPPTTDAPPQ